MTNPLSVRGMARSRRRQREEALWESADTFEAVCDLTARWIEGGLIHHPGYGADEVDDETLPIRDTLVALNRAGCLTYGSEPADAGDNLYGSTGLPWRCRSNMFAWIAEPRLLYLLDDVCRSHGLWMVTAPAEHGTITDGYYWTLEADGQPVDVAHADELEAPGRDEIWFPHEAAAEQVLAATWVRVIDPDFDAGMRMWRALDTVARIRARARWAAV